MREEPYSDNSQRAAVIDESYRKAGWSDGECSNCHKQALVKNFGEGCFGGVLCRRCDRARAGFP